MQSWQLSPGFAFDHGATPEKRLTVCFQRTGSASPAPVCTPSSACLGQSQMHLPTSRTRTWLWAGGAGRGSALSQEPCAQATSPPRSPLVGNAGANTVLLTTGTLCPAGPQHSLARMTETLQPLTQTPLPSRAPGTSILLCCCKSDCC